MNTLLHYCRNRLRPLLPNLNPEGSQVRLYSLQILLLLIVSGFLNTSRLNEILYEDTNFAGSNLLDKATVTTDKLDYTVGQIAYASGAGWEPGETVELNVHEEPVVHDDVVTYVVADENGSFSDVAIYEFEMHDLGASYELTATGEESLQTAIAYFTDAPPAANLDQVRNGSAGNPVDPGAWVNGNLGAQQSHYAESMSAPYRVVMTDLPPATEVSLILGYDVKHSGRNALDYLTHYDRIQPHNLAFDHSAEEIDPTDGVAGFSEPADHTFDIPTPPVLNSPVGGQPTTSFGIVSAAGEATMSIWNGTITAISYPNTADLSQSQAEQQIQVTFTTAGNPMDDAMTVILAWGGHIGSRQDWGFVNGVPRSAGGISGSPYHMRLKDWNLNNLGQQDRSLSAGAIIPPPDCILDGPEVVCEGEENEYIVDELTGAINPTYHWEILPADSDASFVGGTPSTSVTSATVLAGTEDYTVRVTINSSYGSTSCEIPVTVNPAPPCSITGDDSACPGTSGLVYTGPAGMDYFWSISGDGSIDGSTTSQSVTVDADNVCDGSFTLTLETTLAGCTSSCEKTVTIEDNTPPDAGDDASSTVQCISEVTEPTPPVVSDDCGGTITPSGPVVGGTYDGCEGTVTYTWTYTDCSGISDDWVYTYTIDLTTGPDAGADGSSTVECIADASAPTPPSVDDHCGNAITPSGPAVGGTYDGCEGTRTYTWTYTDCAGNSDDWVYTYTIDLTTPPTLNVPADVTLLCNVSTDPSNTGNATAVDACDNPLDVDYSDDASGIDVCGNGKIIRTWKTIDCAGNMITKKQEITINDCADIELMKTTNGTSSTTDWSFSLWEGPDGFDEVEITTETSNGGVFFANVGPLSASKTYTVCETGIPSGWTSVWMIDRNGDGVINDSDLPVLTPYNPNADDMPSEDLGNRCFDFGAGTSYPLPLDNTIACKLLFEVDNSYPGGDPRTPGYWKNWNTCSGGNQVETAAKNGGTEAGWYILDDIVGEAPGIVWDACGTSNPFTIDNCQQAVYILDQRQQSGKNRKMASDAAYTLAMHLLAAQLNYASGAERCDATDEAIIAAELLLCNLGYDGTGSYLRPKDAEYSYALCLAKALDEYNNGNLCPDGVLTCSMSDAQPATNAVNAITTEEKQSFSDGIDMRIFPNPAYHEFFLDVKGLESQDVLVQIYDRFGRIVREQKVSYYENDRIRMTIPDVLSDGIYYVGLKHQADIKMKPIVITKDAYRNR